MNIYVLIEESLRESTLLDFMAIDGYNFTNGHLSKKVDTVSWHIWNKG